MAKSNSETVSEDLKRGLSIRHLTMISIGGAIGTGLFVASGETISTAGPGGALLAYALIGMMVYLLTQSLGEMASYLPVSGSFGEFAHRYVSPSFGFATGWNYWFSWASALASEIAASTLVMKYWFPDVSGWIWSALFLAILVGLNVFSARAYGEGEFWFASIKVVAILVFIILGVAMIFGILGGSSPGFSNWTTGDAPFVGGFPGIFAVFLVAGYSFQGTEIVGVAAGEAKDPDKSVPRAIRTIFWRILLFYIGAIIVIGFLISYTDPNLLNSDIDNISVSPFTLVFERAGIAAAASVMNAVILTSILSAGNSGLYAATRMLYRLALQGGAPRFLARTSRNKVPVAAMAVTAAIGATCFLTSFVGDGVAYMWLVNASGLSGFIVWMGIAWSHYRFRQAFIAQGRDLSEIPFKAKFYPAGPVIAIVMCVFIIVGQSYLLSKGGEGISGFVISYAIVPVFLMLWGLHKLIVKPPKVTPQNADLSRTYRPAADPVESELELESK